MTVGGLVGVREDYCGDGDGAILSPPATTTELSINHARNGEVSTPKMVFDLARIVVLLITIL